MEILTVGEKQDHRLYVIRFNDVRILIGTGIDFDQTLSYLPQAIELYSDEERNGPKKLRPPVPTPASPQLQGGDLSPNPSPNPSKPQTPDHSVQAQQPLQQPQVQHSGPPSKRYTTIDNTKYLTGEVKYDLSLYTSVDIASIDYILITKLDNIYALPILTQGFRFDGTIVMTQPMHQLGYQILKEFASINEQRKQRASAFDSEKLEDLNDLPFIKNIWEDTEELDQFEKEGKYISEWVSCFTQEDLDSCWERVRVVNYKEELIVRGGVKIVPISSGYHLGSACYSISLSNEKLLVMDSYSYHRYRHSLPFDYKALREHNKVLITDSFYSSDKVRPKVEAESRLTQAELAANKFVQKLKEIIKEHKSDNILLPIRNLFFLLDIVDILRESMPGFRRIHVLSSTAEPMVKYANANVDYLNKTLQSKIYKPKPELPFGFERFFEENRMQFFTDIHEFVESMRSKPHYMIDTTPSIYIVVDSTFRLGYSGKIFDIMNNEIGSGTVVFTDPYLCHSKIFEPLYLMNRLRIVHFPLNFNDSLVSTVNLIKKDTPDSKIIVPERYVKLLKSSPIGDRLLILKDNQSIEFDFSTRDTIFAKPQVFLNLKPKNLEAILPYKIDKSDLAVDSFMGSLTSSGAKLNLHIQEPRKEELSALLCIDKNLRLNDQLMQDRMLELAKRLKESGIQVIDVEKRMDETGVFVLKCAGSVIKHSPIQTEIFTDNEQEYKIILKNIWSVLGVCAI